MADTLTPLGQANQQNDINGKAALQAIAQNGNVGLDAYKQGLQQVGTNQQNAINDALNTAIAKQAPVGARDALSQTISAPGDLFKQSLAAGQQSYSNQQAALQSGFGNYMKEAAAAVPAIQAANDSQIGLMKERWDQQRIKELNAQSDAQLAQLGLGAAENAKQKDVGTADTNAQQLFDQRQKINDQAHALQMQVDQLTAQAAKQAGPQTRGLPPDDAAAARQGLIDQAVPAELRSRLNQLNQQSLNINGQIQDQVLSQKTQGMSPQDAAKARSDYLTGDNQLQGPQMDQAYKQALEQQAMSAYNQDKVNTIGRQALLARGIDPDRVAALNIGASPEQQLATLKAQQELQQLQGGAGTAQQQISAYNDQQKLATIPQMTPQSAAAAAGIKDYTALSTSTAPILDDKGKPTKDSKTGAVQSENIFDQANQVYQQLAQQGDSPDVINQKMANAMKSRYGQDYPDVRNTVTYMYAPPKAAPQKITLGP